MRGRDPRSSVAAFGGALQLDLFGPSMPVRLRDHPLWAVWSSMKDRCSNPKADSFKNYGGRGIVICEEWRASSRPFIAWALSNGWKPGLQIDRRDNDGPYCPSNCRFVSPAVNGSNRRDTLRVSDGRAAIHVAALYGLNYLTVTSRVHQGGWSVDEAATLPLGSRPSFRVKPARCRAAGAGQPQGGPHRAGQRKPANAAPAASPALCDGINKRKGRAK